MTRVLMCAALLCVLAACSDEKPGTSSSSSSSSSGSSESKPDKAEPDNPTEPEKDEKDDGKDEPKPDTEEGNPVTDTTDPAKEQPVAERGFKESKQAEGESLDGKEMAANVYYEGGDRVKVSNLGFSFVVPKGEKAVIAQGGSAINVGATDGKFLSLIIARTGITEAEARDMISQTHDMGNGVMLKPQGEIEKSGDRVSRALSASTLSGYAQMLIGKSCGVAVVTFGLTGSEKECKSVSAKLADSIKFATPAGEKHRLEYEAGLKGKCVHVFKYKGAKDYSWSSETNRYWHFGSDHTYEYFSRNTNSGSYDTGSYAADNDSAHSGTWSIELTLSLPELILRTSDGRIITHVLNRNATHMTISGDEAMVKASDRKR